MAEPTLLAIAKADLLTAKKLVYSENKYQKHQAAYMTQQSIEKTLKYLIQLRTGSQPWGHDIRKLVLQGQAIGIYIPPKIVEKADVYTNWEVISRYYPTKVIYRNSIIAAIDATHEWHKLLTKQDIK